MGPPLQRLFSTFPDGWPGTLVYFGFAGTAGAAEQSLHVALCLVAAAGGLLLLLGLWTPVAGIAVAIDELWIAFSPHFSQMYDQRLHILLAVLAAAIAMLGPGAWSVEIATDRPH